MVAVGETGDFSGACLSLEQARQGQDGALRLAP
jgi:hypothetical protein